MQPLPHPPAAVVRSKIDDHQRAKSIPQGLASLAGSSSLWILSLVGIALLPWYAKIPLALLNGIAISMMFVVGHDAGHGALFPVRWMNRLAGRWSLLPALHPFTSWVHNHNGLHHGFTNIKEKDPGFPPLSLEEYQALSRFGRWHYRACRTVPGLALLYFSEMWLKWELFPNKARAPRNPKQFQLDRLMVFAFFAAWIGLLVGGALLMEEGALGIALNILLGFVVPYALWNWFIAFMIFQQHTHPRIAWFSELDKPSPSYFEQQVESTPYLYYPGWVRFTMRHIMEHTAHHADPSIPLYELAEAQRQITKAYRKEMVRVIWSPASFKVTMRTCKLYDYKTHRWIDYKGNPLTESLHQPQQAEAPALAS